MDEIWHFCLPYEHMAAKKMWAMFFPKQLFSSSTGIFQWWCSGLLLFWRFKIQFWIIIILMFFDIWSRTAKIYEHLVTKTARKNQSVLPAVLTFASSSNSKAEVFVKSTKFWTIELLGHEWSNNLSMKLKTFFLTLKLGVVRKLFGVFLVYTKIPQSAVFSLVLKSSEFEFLV